MGKPVLISKLTAKGRADDPGGLDRDRDKGAAA